MTFRSNSTESQTRLSWNDHTPSGNPKECSTSLQQMLNVHSILIPGSLLLERHVLCTLIKWPLYSGNTYNSSPMHPHDSIELPKDTGSRLAFQRTHHIESYRSPHASLRRACFTRTNFMEKTKTCWRSQACMRPFILHEIGIFWSHENLCSFTCLSFRALRLGSPVKFQCRPTFTALVLSSSC